MVKTTIGIDIDEVLAELLTEIIGYHNDTYNTTATKADFIHYHLAPVFGISVDEERKRIGEFIRSDYFKRVQSKDGAEEGMKRIEKKYHPLAVTSRQHYIADETVAWLEPRFPELLGVYFANNWVNSEKKESKAEVCKRFGITLLLEDYLPFAEQCAREGIKVLLFDAPWNQKKDLEENIIRVFGWKEALEYLKV